MQEHPLIELYVNVGSEQQNALIEQQLSSVDLDRVALQTLQAVDIDQQVMFTLLVTDDESIHDMNKQYRDQDKPTDVLSFPLLQEPLVNAPVDQLWSTVHAEDPSSNTEQPAQGFITPPGMVTNLGDIVMSWPTITRQATEAGHEPLVEFLYLLSHGLLHLVGYDDHTEAGYQTMVHIQQTVLQALGYQG
jgi:probable rRNA maturation factor